MKRARITLRDLFLLAYIPLFGALAWLLPERSWSKISRFKVQILSTLRYTSRSLRHKLGGNQPDDTLLTSSEPEAQKSQRQLAEEAKCDAHLSNFYTFRAVRPGPWHLQIDLQGYEHIDAALRADKGVILWVAPLRFSHLVSKIAFAQAGYEVVHLSRVSHGISKTRFGIRYINWLWVAAENRFLSERIVIRADNTPAAMRTLSNRVREKKPVSITFANTGNRVYEGEILGVPVKVGAGAITLAHRSKAALLPVFTVRTGNCRFSSTVYPSLNPSAYNNRETAGHACVANYIKIAEQYKQNYPAQFGYW